MYALLITLAVAAAALLAAAGTIAYTGRKNAAGQKAGYVIIPLLGCEEPEQRVRSAYWEEMFRSPGNRRDIIIVTSLETGQRYLAAMLASELRGVETVDITALADCLIKKERKQSLERKL